MVVRVIHSSFLLRFHIRNHNLLFAVFFFCSANRISHIVFVFLVYYLYITCTISHVLLLVYYCLFQCPSGYYSSSLGAINCTIFLVGQYCADPTKFLMYFLLFMYCFIFLCTISHVLLLFISVPILLLQQQSWCHKLYNLSSRPLLC